MEVLGCVGKRVCTTGTPIARRQRVGVDLVEHGVRFKEIPEVRGGDRIPLRVWRSFGARNSQELETVSKHPPSVETPIPFPFPYPCRLRGAEHIRLSGWSHCRSKPVRVPTGLPHNATRVARTADMGVRGCGLASWSAPREVVAGLSPTRAQLEVAQFSDVTVAGHRIDES